jgi:hypothetical protein
MRLTQLIKWHAVIPAVDETGFITVSYQWYGRNVPSKVMVLIKQPINQLTDPIVKPSAQLGQRAMKIHSKRSYFLKSVCFSLSLQTNINNFYIQIHHKQKTKAHTKKY